MDKEQIRAELHLLRGRVGATMIEVTHDPAEALALGPRVAVLADGLVVQVGPPRAVYDRPRLPNAHALWGSRRTASV